MILSNYGDILFKKTTGIPYLSLLINYMPHLLGGPWKSLISAVLHHPVTKLMAFQGTQKSIGAMGIQLCSGMMCG